MKFTLSWLKDHLETDASAEEIADKLTNIGLEVEEVSNPAEALAPFRVAKVLTAEKHPQADKLQVLTVDAGDGRANPGRVRRAQRTRRDARRVRAAGSLHPRQRPYAEGRRYPRRRNRAA